jgi:AraC family transcriptional regulator
MLEIPDLMTEALGHPVMLDELELLQQKGRQIPGSWQFTIHRFHSRKPVTVEDTGMLVYHWEPGGGHGRLLELRFCLDGGSWCSDRVTDCDACRNAASERCEHKGPSIDLLQFRFEPTHLAHFVKSLGKESQAAALLDFRHTESFFRDITITRKIRETLLSILGNSYTDATENIFMNAQTQILILYTLESMYQSEVEESVPACKFLSNELDREKIVLAREILLRHIGDPITIRELSRKVAINECYLKKGFKVMYGMTIFDFYQDQRMEHAKYLLYEKGQSVSEVSVSLGYSSISHFSAAFKKHTGIKPCELLSR